MKVLPRTLLIVAAFLVVVGLLAGLVVLRDRHGGAGAKPESAATTIPRTAQAPARGTAQTPAPARPTATTPDRPTPSQVDAAAARRPDWPYAAHEGGTPALVAALSAGMDEARRAQATKPSTSRTLPASPRQPAVADPKPESAAVPADARSGTQPPAVYSAKDFWHPPRRGPGRRPLPSGGWTSDPRPTSKGNG